MFSGNVWHRGVTLPHPITATQLRSYQHKRNNLALRTHYFNPLGKVYLRANAAALRSVRQRFQVQVYPLIGISGGKIILNSLTFLVIPLTMTINSSNDKNLLY